MSVINKMLKDMEKRKATVSHDDQSDEQTRSPLSGLKPPKSASTERSRSNKQQIKLILLIVLLLIFLFLIARLIYIRHESQKKVDLAQATAQIAQRVRAIKAARAVLSSVSLGSQGGITSLSLSLSKVNRYSVKELKNTAALEWVLPNTSLTGTLPTVEDNPAVASITSVSKDHNLTINISLKPKAMYLGVKQIQGETPALILNIQEPAPPAPTVNEPSQPAPVAAPAKTNTAPSQPALAAMDFSKTNVAQTPKEAAEQYYDQALQALGDGSQSQAISLLEQSLSARADYLPSQQALITLLVQQQQFNLANQYLNQALLQRPQNIELLQLKARVQLAQGHAAAALSTLESYSPSLSNNTDYYALIAAIQQRLGHYALAGELYRQVITVDPSNAKLWLGLGVCLERLNKVNAAVDAYQHAAELGTLSPSLQAFVSAKINTLGGSVSSD